MFVYTQYNFGLTKTKFLTLSSIEPCRVRLAAAVVAEAATLAVSRVSRMFKIQFFSSPRFIISVKSDELNFVKNP